MTPGARTASPSAIVRPSERLDFLPSSPVVWVGDPFQASKPFFLPRATASVPAPLPPTPALTMMTRRHHPMRVIVRAGVGWSGAGTLAVALGGVTDIGGEHQALSHSC